MERILPDRFELGLSILLEAANLAADTPISRWEFAVEIGSVSHTGENHASLRWMIANGYLEHRREVTTLQARRRVFRACRNRRFIPMSCFMLTDKGIAIARRFLDGFKLTSHDSNREFPNRTLQQFSPINPTQPQWDPVLRELRFGDVIVKRFLVPAQNQEIVLNAFQEDGWAKRIDDPLPPVNGREFKRRLHSTINSLNRNQKCKRIHFSSDANGHGIRWEAIPAQ